jgi:hypothetical protein
MPLQAQCIKRNPMKQYIRVIWKHFGPLVPHRQSNDEKDTHQTARKDLVQVDLPLKPA